MNKTEKIKFYKKQLNSSKQLKSVAMQNYNLATQLESEAKSALEMLGAKPERSRKGDVLSEETKTQLIASLTKEDLFNITKPIQ